MASVIRGSDNFDSAGVGKNASVGSVGSYAWLGYPTSSQNINAGDTESGSNLRYAGTASTNTYNDDTAARIGYSTPSTPSGTWRAMGGTGNASRYHTTIWLRIS